MSTLNLAHIPVILQHMSVSPAFSEVLVGKDVILYRLSASDEQTVLVEGFKPSYERYDTTVDAYLDRRQNIVWVGRKEQIYQDYDRTVEGHNTFDIVNSTFRWNIFEDFGIPATPCSTTYINLAKLLES